MSWLRVGMKMKGLWQKMNMWRMRRWSKKGAAAVMHIELDTPIYQQAPSFEQKESVHNVSQLQSRKLPPPPEFHNFGLPCVDVVLALGLGHIP
ncbi:OLC1v1004858C1, partial [Oldenlandia corymbosa var. corymbosa]